MSDSTLPPSGGQGHTDRNGGNPSTGEPNFVDIVLEKGDAGFPMALSAWYDEQTDGIILANFDNYMLPPSEVRRLLELALRTAEAYGQEAVLERNRDAAASYKEYQQRLEVERRERKKPTPKPGYVYVIEGDGAYKIGRAKNVDSRVKQFGIKLPFRVRLVWQGYFEDYIGAEAELHERFANKRLDGEWFDLSDEDLAYIRGLGK